MPETFLFIMLAIVVVAAIVIFKVVKSVLQGMLFVSAVLAIVSAVATVVVVRDALDLKDNFATGSKLMLFSAADAASGQERITSGMLLKAQQEDVAGATAVSQPAALLGNDSNALSDSEIEAIDANFRAKDYGAMKGGNFKLIIVKEEAIISALPDSIPDGGENISREAVLEMLSESGKGERAAILSALFFTERGNSPLSIISDYKKGNIFIYPETPAFKVIKVLPEWLIT